jgi:transcriptional regulator GlxA family with amidase domain
MSNTSSGGCRFRLSRRRRFALTSSGPRSRLDVDDRLSCLDLCLHLVRKDYGAETANSMARRMVVAPHREGGQVQFMEPPVAAPLALFADTCAWARQNLAQPLTVADMAAHAGWSPSGFTRRFTAEAGMTPMKWLNDQRTPEASTSPGN